METYHPNLDGPAEPIGLAMPPADRMNQLARKVAATVAEMPEAGARAYRNGFGPEANPYGRQSEYHSIWYAGWAATTDADPKRDH